LNIIFNRNRKINPKIHMQVQKTAKSESNPEQKEEHNTKLHTILQSQQYKYHGPSSKIVTETSGMV
jgi:hypothetical protein